MPKFYVRCWKCWTKHYNTSSKVFRDEFKNYVCRKCYLEDPLHLKKRRPTFSPATPQIVQNPDPIYPVPGLTWDQIVFTWETIGTNWEDL